MNCFVSATFAVFAAQKVGELAGRLELLIAFELVAAAQAIDLARPERIAPRLAKVHEAIRERSRFIDDDRPLGREIEAIAAELVASGRLMKIAQVPSPRLRGEG